MKKILIATVATAALVVAAPAFAQPEPAAPPANVEAPATTIEPAAEATQEATTEATPEAVAAEAETTTEAEAQALAETPAAEITTTAEAGTAASAETQTASLDAQTQSQMQVELPDEVEAAIADGRYTPDDLNRAQLAALNSAPPVS